jgi:sulfur relay (sulfurtransferase) complex TusBCD TusD component (DsrE family)
MIKTISALLMSISLIQAFELNTQMKNFMDELLIEAKKQNPNLKEFDYSRGEKIFTTQQVGKKGKKISCVTCHTADLSKRGLNENTNKAIEPLSPLANPKRFSDAKEVKKWLKRNFNDVYNREGTAQEQGDVVTYIINKK